MVIDNKLISKLENLARLELDETERKKIRHDLNEILKMVEKLNDLDTTGVEPLVYVNEAEVNEWREDKIVSTISREEALKNAPDQDGVYFKVPKVIK
ncbi:MAG: Asp-tRNA(Asn)/Glu-tRNA(Gln) amidotransferase subunit GatC [Saprospiraceae bacterium]|nr:Asp-tRNA(Asn)/Glu-tRNA(Gln) amidotransferase subunit GatC [Saprospiraceae bacterium]MCB9323226.1 Asp-tRNA(Asn)/Glu-tRNA(Gln) amidotransferase subunit GatC [Lewinellaceae bacterium]